MAKQLAIIDTPEEFRIVVDGAEVKDVVAYRLELDAENPKRRITHLDLRVVVQEASVQIET